MNEQTIFADALDQETADARTAYLDQACGNDSQLRERVEALLRAHAKRHCLLDGTRMHASVDSVTTWGEQAVGTTIGPYTLRAQIGEGGMGVVYRAAQTEPVRREVALKIIKPGMDTRQVIARFEAERQALARMDHPNIARVLDAGATAPNPKSEARDSKQTQNTRSETQNTFDLDVSDMSALEFDIVSDFGFRAPCTSPGRPYFVMELVRGIPITEYCDKAKLDTSRRLELFVEVCQAVQHAHQKGIIHRDIKPSNVLVTEYDGRPVPKIIDFGVAKAIGQPLKEETMLTQIGQVVGTVEYMSPEQARLSQLDIDTRTDVYSLGVLLYELLSGETPFDRGRLASAAFDEMLRIIREEEPPKPSARLRSSPALPAIAVSRNSEPTRLTRTLRGELDWIVIKAMEKERSRRYETAGALAADVHRYLANEPLEACPQSPVYRFRKFARRNRAVLAVATVAAVGVLVAVAALAISHVQVSRTLVREQSHLYFHAVALAHRELTADNLARAVRLLDECPHALRQWEWNYLERLCRVEPLVLRGHGQGVYAVDFSPDSRLVAAANEDGTVTLVDTANGRELQALPAHQGHVFSLAFHPDGKHLASAGADRTVKLWDLTTRQMVFSLRGHSGAFTGAAYSLDFSPDGRRLAVGLEDRSVVVCSSDDGRVILRLTEPEHEGFASSVAFSPDGCLLASASFGGVLRIWDARTGRLLHERRSHEAIPISAVVFRPDGRWLATAGYDRRINLWETSSGRLLRTLSGHTGLVVGLAFSTDGRRLASTGEDKTIKLWDPATGQEVLNLRGHTALCQCLVFSPDGRRLASASMDGTIRIWDATPLQAHEGLEQLTLRHDHEVWSVAFSPEARLIATASWDKTVKLWDAANGALVQTLGHPGVVFRLAFSPDGGRLVSTSQSPDRRAVVRIWNVATGRELLTLHDAPPLFCVAFSPDGRYVLKGGDGEIAVWDAQTGQAIGILEGHKRDVWCLTFSPDGTRLASAANDGRVLVWDATRLSESQQPLCSIAVRVVGGFGERVAFTSDGGRLFTGGEAHTVKVWDATSGQELRTLAGHSGDVFSLACSPDGKWLASAGEDTAIRIWNVETGQRVRTIRGHTGLISSLAFSPDGRRLVSGSRDQTARVWDMTPDDVAQR